MDTGTVEEKESRTRLCGKQKIDSCPSFLFMYDYNWAAAPTSLMGCGAA